jgi:hypothetical protein
LRRSHEGFMEEMAFGPGFENGENFSEQKGRGRAF